MPLKPWLYFVKRNDGIAKLVRDLHADIRTHSVEEVKARVESLILDREATSELALKLFSFIFHASEGQPGTQFLSSLTEEENTFLNRYRIIRKPLSQIAKRSKK